MRSSADGGCSVVRVVPDGLVAQRGLLLGLALEPVGLAVHLRGGALAPAARDVLGDALWAAMVVWWAGALAPGLRPPARAALALGFCYAVEAGQLYHAPWLDAVRSTRPGHLVLGSGFDPRDLAAYALGVLAAALLDRALARCGAGAAAGPGDIVRRPPRGARPMR